MPDLSGMNERIYLSSPHMCGREMAYIKEAFDTNWIAPLGKNVDEFEKEVAAYVGMKHAAALVSGTGAIHLALKWFGVKQGDYVFCSSLTFSGSCNAILYEKANPVFIDSEPCSYNMSPVALEKAFAEAKKINKMPKAVIIVNLYGTSADYGKLLPICKHYGVPVIEDAAESLGACYKGQQTGSFGDAAILSFNGNKIITTSGGGMLLCNDEQAIKKARFWATQSREPALHYQHAEIGYNYRLSNICAGIGRGQLTVLNERIVEKGTLHSRYVEYFKGTALEIIEAPKGMSNYWLTVARLKTDKINYTDIIQFLAAENIESRPIWKPMHMQPVFDGCKYYSHSEGSDVSEGLFYNGICLPSDTKMTAEQQNRVMTLIGKVIK